MAGCAVAGRVSRFDRGSPPSPKPRDAAPGRWKRSRTDFRSLVAATIAGNSYGRRTRRTRTVAVGVLGCVDSASATRTLPISTRPSALIRKQAHWSGSWKPGCTPAPARRNCGPPETPRTVPDTHRTREGLAAVTFEYPGVLFLLIAPALLLAWVWMREGRRVSLPVDHGPPGRGFGWARAGVVRGVCVPTSAGRQRSSSPPVPGVWESRSTSAKMTNIEICVDVSGSMNAPLRSTPLDTTVRWRP